MREMKPVLRLNEELLKVAINKLPRWGKIKHPIPIKGLLIIQLTITGSGLTILQQIRHTPMNHRLLPDLFLQHRQILRRHLYPVRESALHGKTTPTTRPALKLNGKNPAANISRLPPWVPMQHLIQIPAFLQV